jgi:hypothetical protein
VPPCQHSILALVIPPKKPLSLDILLYIVDFLGQYEDIVTLNNIRRTSRTVRHSRLVLKQLIFAHTDRPFDGPRRLATFCEAILRRPRDYPALLVTIQIANNVHDHSSATQPCVCVALAEVLRHSSMLATVEIEHIDTLLSFDPNDKLSKCLCALPSLRSLRLNGVGPLALRMLRHMRPGLRSLNVSNWNFDDTYEGDWTIPLLSALSGLSSSLETVVVTVFEQKMSFDESGVAARSHCRVRIRVPSDARALPRISEPAGVESG